MDYVAHSSSTQVPYFLPIEPINLSPSGSSLPPFSITISRTAQTRVAGKAPTAPQISLCLGFRQASLVLHKASMYKEPGLQFTPKLSALARKIVLVHCTKDTPPTPNQRIDET